MANVREFPLAMPSELEANKREIMPGYLRGVAKARPRAHRNEDCLLSSTQTHPRSVLPWLHAAIIFELCSSALTTNPAHMAKQSYSRRTSTKVLLTASRALQREQTLALRRQCVVLTCCTIEIQKSLTEIESKFETTFDSIKGEGRSDDLSLKD